MTGGKDLRDVDRDELEHSKKTSDLSDDACLALAEVALTRPAPLPENTKTKLRASAEEYIARTAANKGSLRTSERLKVMSKATSEKSGSSTTAATELAIIPIGAKTRPVWTRSSVLLAAAAAAFVWIAGGALRYSSMRSIAGNQAAASIAYECATSDGSSNLTLDTNDGSLVEGKGSIEVKAAFAKGGGTLNIGKDSWAISPGLAERGARTLSPEAQKSLRNNTSDEVFVELSAASLNKPSYRFSCRKKP
jgi:hypothetical protein